MSIGSPCDCCGPAGHLKVWAPSPFTDPGLASSQWQTGGQIWLKDGKSPYALAKESVQIQPGPGLEAPFLGPPHQHNLQSTTNTLRLSSSPFLQVLSLSSENGTILVYFQWPKSHPDHVQRCRVCYSVLTLGYRQSADARYVD